MERRDCFLIFMYEISLQFFPILCESTCIYCKRKDLKPQYDIINEIEAYRRQFLITDLAFTSTLYVPANTFINSGFPCLAAQ